MIRKISEGAKSHFIGSSGADILSQMLIPWRLHVFYLLFQ